MASIRAVLRDKFSQLVFKPLTLDETRDLSPHFRRLRFSAPWLRDAGCAPGDKLQIMIAEAGPRTYTPFDHDADSGKLDVIAYMHGDTATASWIRAARPGLSCRVFGPRGSLSLANILGPVVFFGDETSFGTATALQRARGAADGVSFVFEVSEQAEAAQVLGQLGLQAQALITRKPAHAHLAALEEAVRTAASKHANARLVLTGHAQSIQGLRKRLKAQALQTSGQTVKAYWADGKRGLD